MPKVYITGLGFITSIGNDSAAVAANLRALRHGFELFAPFQKPDIACKVTGPIRGFHTDSTDPEDWTWPEGYSIKRETIRSMANRETGLFAASGGSPMLTYFHHERMLRLGPARCSPLGIVASIVGTLNFNLVAAFRIQGASCGFSSACASSAHALAYAFEEISVGRQKRMFVVGGEDGNRDAILPFAGMRTLSLQTDPDIASRPFDLGRDGFVGTGGGVVAVLESEAEVERRGVPAYCELVGWGQASDGYNVAISHPDGTGSRMAMENALAATGIAPGEVDYVNAHATSTVIGDVSEARALRSVFTDKGAHPAVSSTKALTGHGLSLAGVMEVGFCCLMMRDGFVAGSAHISRLDPACEGLNILRATRAGAPKVVLKNSSGFGGANVAILLRRS
jgi:3-oxoacyl-[acyl-carrier-protein] synthase-1